MCTHVDFKGRDCAVLFSLDPQEHPALCPVYEKGPGKDLPVGICAAAGTSAKGICDLILGFIQSEMLGNILSCGP